MPKWQPASEDVKRRFEEAVKLLPGVEVRKMFGYPTAYFNGQMFAGVFQESMMVRLPSDERARLLSVPGAAPFEPMPGRPMREYVVVPPAMTEEPAELGEWLHKALAYVAAMPPKAPKPAKAPKTKSPAKLKT